MYYGSEEFNRIIESANSQALKLRITLEDDTQINSISSARYIGGSNGYSDIQIGVANTSYVELSIQTNINLNNREFLLEAGAKLSDGTYEYAPIGYFTAQRPDETDYQITLTAYDRMIRFEQPYFSKLSYPTTSDKVLNEICAQCGIEVQAPITNPIPITENVQGYTCREVLGFIAGVHGFFACIDRYGKLHLRWYDNTVEKPYNLAYSLDKSEEYIVEKIEFYKDSETSYVSGDGNKTIYTSNPYATQNIADNVFAALDGFSFTPAELKILDDIRIDPWDIVKIVDTNGTEHLIPAMEITHNFDGGSTTVTSVGASDTENQYRYDGPIIKMYNRMSAQLLTVEQVVATKVDAEWVKANTLTAEEADIKYVQTDRLEAIEADITKAVIDEVSAEFVTTEVLDAEGSWMRAMPE